MKKILPILALALIVWSCQTKNPDNSNTESSPMVFSLTELWSTDSVMKTPESVLYDPQRNVLYVANMNRTEEGDDTGFISKLNPDGSVINLNWITGLNEPRGMGIHGDLLFATDMNRLAIIDLQNDKLLKTVPVDNSLFLNDLSIDKDGKVYFSDSRDGKVYTYSDDKVEVWLDSLQGPNGLFDLGENILVSVSGAGEVRDVNKESGAYEVMATGIGVDGIEYTGIDDYYIMSEWSGRIHIVGNDTIQKVLDSEAQKINTADIGYNMKEKVVYVPTFFDNRVVAYKLEGK